MIVATATYVMVRMMACVIAEPAELARLAVERKT